MERATHGTQIFEVGENSEGSLARDAPENCASLEAHLTGGAEKRSWPNAGDGDGIVGLRSDDVSAVPDHLVPFVLAGGEFEYDDADFWWQLHEAERSSSWNE